MAKKGPFCPLIQKPCIEHKCAWYANIQGKNPQTGDTVDNWDCVVTLIPFLQMEQAKTAMATQAATVDVRENIEKATQVTIAAAMQQQQVLEAAIDVDP